MNQAMIVMQQLQAATQKAREKTGDERIGTRANAGRIDIIRAEPRESGRGSYVIETLKTGLTADEAVTFLEAM